MSDVTIEAVLDAYGAGTMTHAEALAALKGIYGYAPMEGEQWLDDARREYLTANSQFGVGA